MSGSNGFSPLPVGTNIHWYRLYPVIWHCLKPWLATLMPFPLKMTAAISTGIESGHCAIQQQAQVACRRQEWTYQLLVTLSWCADVPPFRLLVPILLPLNSMGKKHGTDSSGHDSGVLIFKGLPQIISDKELPILSEHTRQRGAHLFSGFYF